MPLSRAAGGGRGGGRGGGATLGPVAWLPDGRRAVIRVAQDAPDPANQTDARGAPQGARALAGTGRTGAPGDLLLFSLDHPAKLDTVVATPYNEFNPAISPDGRLLAYVSDGSGRNEVYIRRLDGSAQRQISLNGGTQPKWARSGRELFYVNSDTLLSAEVRSGEEFGAGEVKALFTSRNMNGGYGVLGDTAFITPPVPATNLLVVITNVAQELNRLFGKK
jgi:hypothetical protein